MKLDDYMKSYGIKKSVNDMPLENYIPDELKKYIWNTEALNCRLEKYLTMRQ